MIRLVDLLIVHIPFGSSQSLVPLKIKTVTYYIRETWAITPTNLLKKDWAYSSIFKASCKKVLGAAKASLVFIKSRCKSCRLQVFFKIGVLKNFVIFREKHLCWCMLLIKLQAFRRFPVNIAKFLRAAFFRATLVAASADVLFTLYFQKSVAE